MRKPPFSFYCDGCGVSDVDMAYVCSPCEFWLHKSCATFVAFTSECHNRRHHHRLSLALSFPEEHRRYDYKCEVCDKLFDRTCWVYYCGDCRYFVHVKSNTDRLAGFPMHASDVFHKLIKPFVIKHRYAKSSSRRVGSSSPLPLENYHKHPLSLVLNDGDKDENETKICDVCITPIPSSTPYYKWTSYPCAYSIHSVCSCLPHTIHAHDMCEGFLDQYDYCSGAYFSLYREQHIFKLFAPLELEGLPNFFRCHACRCYTNGMGYECEECKILIDVKCTSLPMELKHASHPHSGLVIRTHQLPHSRERRKDPCHGGNSSEINVTYHCIFEQCEFSLDLKCLMLPLSVTEHEYDKHPLRLMFDAADDHSSNFFCEFCEEEMHPKKWMYHCRHCDASFHLDCLKNASGEYRDMKFGRTYEFEGDHPLTFTYITLKKRCDLCRCNVYTLPGFECALCYYVVCLHCGGVDLEKIYNR